MSSVIKVNRGAKIIVRSVSVLKNHILGDIKCNNCVTYLIAHPASTGTFSFLQNLLNAFCDRSEALSVLSFRIGRKRNKLFGGYTMLAKEDILNSAFPGAGR